MSSAQDPFYIVKEEIQESIDKLLSTFRQWEHIPLGNQEQQNLTKELLVGCESIVWQAMAVGCRGSLLQGKNPVKKKNQTEQLVCPLLNLLFDRKVDELDKAISVSSRDPAWYGIDEMELDKRRRWTSTARTQVGNVKKTILSGKELDGTRTSNLSGICRELMRLPNSHQNERTTHQYTSVNNNDDLISSESDRQLLLIRQQDEELDALSASVERIGGVGLTIHEELLAQENIIGDLGMEMESTSNRLDFVQKKVGMVMKKAGAKGQMMMILFLFLLFIILFVLVFFT